MSQSFICIDCGDPYVLNDKEMEFFSGLGRRTGEQLVLPKRCKKCRQLKRERNRARESRERGN